MLTSNGLCTLPVLHAEIELSEPLLPLIPASTRPVETTIDLLLRLHTWPIGELRLTVGPAGVSATDLAHAIWTAAAPQIRQHLRADGLPLSSVLAAGGMCRERRRSVLARAPKITVVIATRDRPASLMRCLHSVAQLEYPNFEVVVVDNAPTTDLTARIITALGGQIGSAPLRYVREADRGLSVARNRGLACATGSWVAMTDDDVTLDRHWLAGIAEAAASGAACVTGLVLPGEITTTAQEHFEQYGGFRRGFALRRFNLDQHRPTDPLFPFTTGRLGTGANMAFDVTVLRELGGFDNALGAGTPARGGEDLQAFLRTLLRGHTIVYQPAALVRHWHRRGHDEFRRQVFGYGVGLSAYLTSAVVADPLLLQRMLRRAAPALRHLLGRASDKNQHKNGTFPRDVELAELLGLCSGPIAYARGRWRGRRPFGS